MNLRELTQRYGLRLIAVVLCGVAGGAAALLVSTQQPTLYEARATLIAQTMGSTHAEVAVSQPVLEYTIAALGLPITPEELGENVEARASQTSAVLTVEARDPDPDRAAAIANTIANRVVELAAAVTGSSAEGLETIQADLDRTQIEIDRTESAIEELSASELTPREQEELQALHDQLASLLSVRAGLQSAALAYSATVLTLLAPAVAPTEPSSPNIPLSTAVGVLAGLAIGVGAPLVTTYLRSRETPPNAQRDDRGRRVTSLSQQQEWSGVPPHRSDR